MNYQDDACKAIIRAASYKSKATLYFIFTIFLLAVTFLELSTARSWFLAGMTCGATLTDFMFSAFYYYEYRKKTKEIKNEGSSKKIFGKWL